MTLSKLESMFDLLGKLTSIDKDLPWTSPNCDPFGSILSCLEDQEKVCSLFQSNSSSECPDTRVRYGHLITSVMHEIAAELSAVKNRISTEPSLISLKNLATVSSAFQFFVLACVSPYLDQGVGIPLKLRSRVIKSWERCTNNWDFRKTQLSFAGECISALFDSNDVIRVNLMSKYCSDIVCIFEQLMLLDPCNNLIPAYKDILSKTDPKLLVCTFVGLLKPRSGVNPPKQFAISIGSQLSAILVSKNGLSVTLSSYEEINGEQFWDNTPLLSALAKQLALPPRNSMKMSYYRNIVSQFTHIITIGAFSRSRVSTFFSMFTEEMRGRNSVAADIFVDDVLFKPWEALSFSTNPSWSDEHDISLCLLRLWSDGKSSSRLLKANPRFLPCASALLSLLSVSDFGKGCSNISVFDDIFATLKCALEDVENLSDFLLAFICDTSPCFELVQQRSLVQEVGGRASMYGKVTLSRIFLSRDELLGRRIDSLITFLKKLGKPFSSKLLLELACKSVEKWNDDALRSAPRFISVDETNVLPKSSWHFVAGVIFEQLQDSDVDCNDKNTILSLLKLIQEILRSVIHYLEQRQKAFDCLDIVAAESEADCRLHATILQNAKMAIGLTGAVVMAAQADKQISSAFSETCIVLLSFFDLVSGLKHKDDDLLVLAADAHKLASLFEKDRESIIVLSPSTNQPLYYFGENSISVLDSIRHRLAEASPVDRGGALLDVGRLIRLRNATVLLQLEEWLFEEMKGALFDSDSYVYLAAINALAETACYNTKYLSEMISLFKNFAEISTSSESKSEIEETVANEPEKGDSVHIDVAVRSRLCEVIGKVFRELGDMSPVWIDKCAGVFLSCFSEEDEILRASASQCLAEIILACHGRNVEKYLNEIFFIVENTLNSDLSALLRRSVVNLLRQIIKSCDTKILEIVGPRLRDLHRKLVHLWRFDADHVVRLHAELALDELKAAIKCTVLEETTSIRC
ncbi:hypothetical protein RB195_010011 [Necator americanus]|uniref:RNA polymerase II assembly factor Rtp1 C-terminal domain-containing protein n=2 Tax=Necator americanus TaxID=51031 RepID=A0ABR1CVZ9_NECAM